MKLIPHKKTNNELVPIEEKKKITFKPNPKFIIISIAVLIILLACLYYFLIYRKPSNILKRYLIKEDFTCEKSICSKEIDKINYDVNYKKGTINATYSKYILSTESDNVKLLIKGTNKSCIYTNNDNVIGKEIDNSFTYNTECKEYIEDANKILEIYNEILESSKVKVSELKK